MPAKPGKAPLPKLRLRGDWSDTGPEARSEREAASANEGQLQKIKKKLLRLLTLELRLRDRVRK